MKYALSITGVVAAIAMACPMLVVIGYFFLIIPGIILTLAPTAFVYLAATAIIRRMLPIASPIAATTAGFGIALLLGWLVMQPSRLKAITAYQTELSDDVVPQQAFKLDGHVRLETPNRRSDPECDYLCLAMLDLPRVQGVTVLTAGRGKEPHREQTAAYTLQSAEADRSIGLYPTMPGQIVHEHPAIVSMLRGTQVITASKAAEADWAVRLAGPERLRLAEPVAADQADWIIHFDRRVDGRKSQVRRITVSDATGKVRFRKSYIKHAVPAPMFCFGFKVQSGMGTIAGASFHVGQQTLESGERSLKLEPTLLTAINAP